MGASSGNRVQKRVKKKFGVDFFFLNFLFGVVRKA